MHITEDGGVETIRNEFRMSVVLKTRLTSKKQGYQSNVLSITQILLKARTILLV